MRYAYSIKLPLPGQEGLYELCVAIVPEYLAETIRALARTAPHGPKRIIIDVVPHPDGPVETEV